MVIYCTTPEATAGVLEWFRELQSSLADPATYFAEDVPHFTAADYELRGVSSVEDPDPDASTERSYSERMSEMVRTAIDAGEAGLDDANPTIDAYVEGIVARLDTFWTNPISMWGQPRP
jgi:hypothetical protein